MVGREITRDVLEHDRGEIAFVWRLLTHRRRNGDGELARGQIGHSSGVSAEGWILHEPTVDLSGGLVTPKLLELCDV
jgi:hypothetical protein